MDFCLEPQDKAIRQEATFFACQQLMYQAQKSKMPHQKKNDNNAPVARRLLYLGNKSQMLKRVGNVNHVG